MSNPAQAAISVDIRRQVPYADGVDMQKQHLRAMRLEGAEPKLFVVEHTPVITLGRSGSLDHLLATEETLRARGIEYHETRRGGDITYHGPGQWTLYPLLPLETFCRDLHRYMRMLEDMVIVYLRGHNIDSGRVDGKTGVWIGHKKIAAIGISVSNWISFHGVAVNIDPDLSVFRNLIIPCGITAQEADVTSLAECLGQSVDMDAEKDRLLNAFFEIFPFTRKDAAA